MGTPATTLGHVVVMALMVISALYMAIPIGIVGNAFNKVWEDRARLLLMKRTRDRLVQLGYESSDIPRLFELVGRKAEGEGELHFTEFRRLMKELKISMSEMRVWELFQTFDKDGGGTIDDKEFMQGLFPATYADHFRHAI